MLLDRVRIAEGARRVSRFVQSARAGEAEHHVDRAHRPVDRPGALQAVARLGLRVGHLAAGNLFLRVAAVRELHQARGARPGGRLAQADLRALDLGDAGTGHFPGAVLHA
jgi:hypothetical protein